MTKIKNENKRSPRRKWRLALGCLLVLATVLLALFWAWDSFCEIPKTLPAPKDFKQLVSSSDRSELEVIQRLFDGVSRQMAWRGTTDSISPSVLQYRCTSDSCKLTRAEITIGVSDFEICRYERIIDGVVIEADIGGIDRGNPRIRLDFWRSGRLEKTDLEMLYSDLTPDLTAIKEYVLNSMGEGVWRIHRALNMKLIEWWDDGWLVQVTPLASSEIVYHAEVSRSEYRSNSEQKQ